MMPTATMVSQSIVVALGSLDSYYGSVVEVINVNEMNSTLSAPLPSDIQQDCNGTLGTVDSDTVVLFCSSTSNPTPASYLLNMTAHAWETLTSNPLLPWYPTNFLTVDPSQSLFVSQTAQGAYLIYTLGSGSISINCELQFFSCAPPNILLATSTNWLCLSSTLEQREKETLASSGVPRMPQWPQWGGNAQHTGQSPVVRPSTCSPSGNVSVNWQIDIQKSFTPVVVGWDGTIYFATSGPIVNSTQVIAIDGTTGTTNWELVIDSTKEVSASPALNSRGILVFGSSSSTFSVDTNTGKVDWSSPTPYGDLVYPLIIQENLPLSDDPTSTLYVAYFPFDGVINAMNADTGAPLWNCKCFEINQLVQPIIAVGVDNDLLYVGYNFPFHDIFVTPSQLIGINSTNSKSEWVLQIPRPYWIYPIITVGADNTVYFIASMLVTWFSELYAVNGTTGEILWTIDTVINAETISLLTVGEVSLAVVSSPGIVYAHNVSDGGKIVWQATIPTSPFFNPIQPTLSPGNLIIIAGYENKQLPPQLFSVFALDYFTGKLVASLTIEVEGFIQPPPFTPQSIAVDLNGNIIVVISFRVYSLRLIESGWTTTMLS